MKRSLPSIGTALAKAAHVGVDRYGGLYRDKHPELVALSRSPRLVRHHMFVQDRPVQREVIFASAMMADYTAVILSRTDRLRLFLPWPGQGQQAVGIPYGLLNSLGSQHVLDDLVVGHLAPSDLAEFAQSIEPLTRLGRVVARPIPVVTVFPRAGTAANPVMVEAELDTPVGEWLLREEAPDNPSATISLDKTPQTGEVHIARVLVPYLTDIDAETYAKILNEEEERITSLRQGLRSAVAELAHSPDVARAVIHDRVEPALANLTQRFNDNARTSARALAGSVVQPIACVLSAIPLTGLSEAVVTGLAAIKAGGIVKEALQFFGKRDEIRQDPFYPLWRIHRHS
ncbi:MAG: hypothetical protein IT435_17620 [Phycisphaerales bacterium]|nr:hypothetical protein [Phycisphaerales bacterium]